MSQNSLTLPTTGTVSGLQMTQYTNLALDTLNTMSSGASAPSGPEAGQLWHDTTNNILKLRSLDNTTWISLFTINETTYNATPVVANSTAGTSSASAANMATVVASMTGGFVNKFRNGTFDIWQRGTSGTVTTGNANYTADGWIVGASGATVSWSQTANASSGFPDYYRLSLTGNSSMSDTFIKQRIESYLAQLLAGQQVTVQFQVYNSTGASITPTLTVKHAATQDNWSSPTTDVSAVNLQSCANNAFTTVAYTFAANTNAYLGLEITLDFGAVLNSNAKTVAILAADIRATPGVSTGLNNNPPVVETRPAFIEMALCQRYFETSYDNMVAPGTATRNGLIGGLGAYSTTPIGTPIRFIVPKRADSATMNYWDGAGNSGKLSTYTAGSWNDNIGSISTIYAGMSSFMAYNPGSNDAGVCIHYSASVEL